ncbi:protein phosphatase CheZ [Herbaspirillum lusitanum]|uniref:Protein phosphatase CheZ n=1 Tax=Herbaspirillum lusitanum TaxID=213312 RepID=A0ABW9A7K9_9BURK
MSDDLDLEALFDEISAKSIPAATADGAAAATPAAAAPAAGDDEDLTAKPMYERLGGIVRLLHDSMRELGYDRSLTDVALQIGDAQGRLEHIATLTEQAANKVLNALDSGMPAQDKLSAHAKDINDRWARLYAGQMNIDEFKSLAGDSQKLSVAVLESTEVEKARMLEIMMAQDFQDITGQLIKKIVAITNIAERELAQLLRDNAPPEVKALMEEKAEKPVELMNGPSAPGAAMAQNDVDDLLDSLGF